MGYEKPNKPHIGHRKRIREHYLNGGFWVLDDADVLELLLTYSIPRRDVYELARKLTELFGSADDVLCADPQELRTRGGLSDQTVTLLKLINDIRSKPFNAVSFRGEKLTSVLSAAEFCRRLIGFSEDESVVEIFLDKDDQVTDVAKVSSGSQDRAELPISSMIEAGIRRGVTRVLVAHNHPSGSSAPSGADVAATESLKRSLSAQKMELVEHVIVARDECTLMLHHQTIRFDHSSEVSGWKDCGPFNSKPIGQ